MKAGQLEAVRCIALAANLCRTSEGLAEKDGTPGRGSRISGAIGRKPPRPLFTRNRTLLKGGVNTMSGPIPKPAKLKLLEGNPGKRKLKPGQEPVPKRGLPECPRRLQGEAAIAWRFLAEEIRAMQLDHLIDGLALEGACVAYGRAVAADEVISSRGMTFTTPNGYVQQRPEVSISERGWKLFKSFCAEFGMTPAARCRLSVAPKVETSAWDSL